MSTPPSTVWRIVPLTPMIHPCLSSTKNTPVSCSGVPLLCFFHFCPPSIVLRTVPLEPTAHPRLASRKYTLMSVTSVPVFWEAAFSCGSASFMEGTMRASGKESRMVKNPVQQGRSKRRGEAYFGMYVEPLSDARTSLVRSASRRAGVGG